MWSTRSFVRDSFKAMFPERAHEIQEKVDPGEYGVESYYLRLVCCFLFVLGLWEDLAGSYEMIDLLWTVPTQSDRWILPVEPSEPPHPSGLKSDSKAPEAAEHADAEHELDFVKFRIAGMPMHWKIFNILIVCIPKFYLWLLTIDIGIVFLMETSVVEEMIINCVALGFILNIDELMMRVMPPECSELLSKLDPFPKDGKVLLQKTEEEEIRYHEMERSWTLCTPALYAALIPRRLISMLLTTSFFILKYYFEHCVREDDGSMVSKTLKLPRRDSLSLLTFLSGPIPMLFPIENAETVWEMPEH
eukprot:gb/GFBE01045489.1/.p1 GENE.gb/GFBE01045489.1/~~gb/GFBE01045489.1/.p1  ORF type:complete len:304 (+),score=47.21 gb/GFBE01045489.1/:1-912(+)